ncbi:DinB family protein [Nocardioides panacisoli]|uniref:mycothiol transferase n=1 Tax=Nocardioides panacisoli TaxID=627624 RepID=UPI001C633819|nr:DUF664 domain-containing protein [Nocardioides panacisoli]QYJ04003.1 DinB family protein [Nocardioides panacisoli]
MSEDQRRATEPTEPAKGRAAGAERWADYLDWLRESMVVGVLALTDEQRRTSRVPSGWTPLELLSHVLHMEQRWFVWGFLGEDVPDPWGDWNVDEPWLGDNSDETRPAARWVVAPSVTAEDLAARLRSVGTRTRGVLRDHPLSATASPGGRFGDEPPTLEWICFHVVAEYARHAGHLDIVVELAATD